MRMFAGPNGSGKSTIKSVISPELLGIYINPDEIEKYTREHGYLDFRAYGITTSKEEVLQFFHQSSLLKISESQENIQKLGFEDNKLIFQTSNTNSYFASVAADFIRNKLIETKQSFTFETVMSHPDKIEILRKAQSYGYRTYLYFVATNDPTINISRVQHRVKMGGHPVPEDKIVSRYNNSLNLLLPAVQNTHRSFIFDNSREKHLLIAEITNGKEMEIKTNPMPDWFKKALWDKLNHE